MDIEITFINNSEDMNNSSVVIFQKNVAESFGEIAVAWKVIKNCGRNWDHKFTYPMSSDISASNTPIRLQAEYNATYKAIDENGRTLLTKNTRVGGNEKNYILENDLPFEVVDADVYKDGKLIAKVPQVAPQQKAVIEIPEMLLYIATVNFNIDEGNILPADFVTSKNHTALNLEGYTNAVIEHTTNESGHSIYTLKKAEAETATAE